MMISLNREYKTIDGCRVEIYAIDGGGDYPVHGAYFQESTGEWIPEMWTSNGKTLLTAVAGGEPTPIFSASDLVEVLPPITVETGKRYTTSNGRPVRIYKIDAGGGYPVHGAYEYVNRWNFTVWTINGKHNSDPHSSGNDVLDLVEID